MAAAALLLAGCSGTGPGETLGVGEPPPSQQGTTTGTAARPAPSPTPGLNRTDMMTVYRAWWSALQGAYAAGDATKPDLALYGADPILTRERNQIKALRAQGVVQRTTFTLTPRILSQGETTAEILDCVTGPANTFFDVATGKPRAPRGYRNDVTTKDPLQILLRKLGGYWYVVAATNQGVRPC
jgi:hypothetical protein